VADDSDSSVLELRGILQPEGFELLRVHERSRDVAERLAQVSAQVASAGARLSGDDGRTASEGWVVGAATTFDDMGPRTFDAPSQLVRVLLPLPSQEWHEGALWAEVLVNDQVVWRQSVAPQRPAVTVAADLAEAVLHVGWHGPADAPVDILLRPREGGSRLRVATAAYGGSVELPVDSLPGGPATVVVRLSSGLRESVGESDPVELPPRRGRLHVRLERTQAPLGQPVTAFASVTDSWGMPRHADDVRWVADDEVVGSGAMAVLHLSEGTHRVHAEADDLEPAEIELTVSDDGVAEEPPHTGS
jgi:hypothetical protein